MPLPRACAAASLLAAGALATEPAPQVRELRDIVVAEVPGHTLLVDLHLPVGVERPPLVVSIFGGGWRTRDRSKSPGIWLAKRGFAVASIDYRLSQEAPFPAQIHDCKGALRWLRAHAGDYGYGIERVGVIGASAGGHLALLLGTSSGVAELEGDVAGNPRASSRVDAIVDFYGPADFIRRAKDQPFETENPGGKVFQLLGGAVAGRPAMARLASPVTHVAPGDPPLLIVHGTADPKVLPNQSQAMVDAYRAAGLPVELHLVSGGGHGGPEYATPAIADLVTAFLDRRLRPH